MRRAVGRACLVCAATVHGAAATRASPASTTAVTAEAGAEGDTNVQRVETGPSSAPRVGAPAGRVGAKVDHRGRILDGLYALQLSTLARLVGHSDIRSENVALLAGDARWLRPVGERPVAVGAGITAADAISLTSQVGARTFSNLGADALLSLRDGETRALTIAAGVRRFRYKPDHDYDWSGPTASARLDLTLWEPAGGTRSVELAAAIGVESRSYSSTALASACPSDAPPSPDCFAGTSLPRRDRHHRAGVEVTWIGGVIAAAGYQLSVTDSNSFGQSLVRHRVTLSATTDLPWKLYGTALATLQIDQYLDGLIVQKDLQHQEFTSLDDENRSSLQLRLAREITGSWSLEGRAAIWRDFGGIMDTAFRRALLYAGVVYSR
jgi:hypothetical protein